ncbi:hypothetical protein CVT24_003685, partial [Panaeolus cyanescens]
NGGHSAAAIQHAIENPVDPRTHNRPGTLPLTNPYIPAPNSNPVNHLSQTQAAYDQSNDLELRQRAQQVTSAISNSYAKAMSQADPRMRLGKPKVRSAASDTRVQTDPVARYSLIIRNIINRNNRRVPGYVAPRFEYSGSTPWGVIIEDIRSMLCSFYTKHFQGFKIRQRSQFQLAFANGTKTQVPPYEDDVQFATIWQECIKKRNLLTTNTDVKLFKLELT